MFGADDQYNTFYGLLIQMCFRDHAPPHFHVKYTEHKAVIDIQALVLLEGSLPRRALNLALDRAELHRDELLEAWRFCQEMENPKPIAPLE
ncbi:MAG: DUF4160 domain-containing protein [Aliidongia sp.]